MSKERKIYPGQRVRVRGTIVDPDTRQRVDPDEVTVIFRGPSNSDQIVPTSRIEQGVYEGSTVVDEHGDWYWRMIGSAPNEAVDEGQFYVTRSSFD